MAAYTLSKSIDNQSVDPVASSAGGGLDDNDVARARRHSELAERARRVRIFDRRHVLTGIWLYELPFGRGKRLASGSGRRAESRDRRMELERRV